MIIDTSAVMAIVLGEPERDAFIRVLAERGASKMSAGTWVELAAVLTGSRRRNLFDLLDRVMVTYGISVSPTTVRESDTAHRAYRTYGLGTNHPARLNFGDCFAYALAKETGEPLLFKGDDFVHTDVTPALR